MGWQPGVEPWGGVAQWSFALHELGMGRARSCSRDRDWAKLGQLVGAVLDRRQCSEVARVCRVALFSLLICGTLGPGTAGCRPGSAGAVLESASQSSVRETREFGTVFSRATALDAAKISAAARSFGLELAVLDASAPRRIEFAVGRARLQLDIAPITGLVQLGDAKLETGRLFAPTPGSMAEVRSIVALELIGARAATVARDGLMSRLLATVARAGSAVAVQHGHSAGLIETAFFLATIEDELARSFWVELCVDVLLEPLHDARMQLETRGMPRYGVDEVVVSTERSDDEALAFLLGIMRRLTDGSGWALRPGQGIERSSGQWVTVERESRAAEQVSVWRLDSVRAGQKTGASGK